jgi:protease-4
VASRKDIAIAIIIVFSFVITVAFFAMMFVGTFSDDGEVSFGGLGPKVAVVDVIGTIDSSESIVKQLKKWGKSTGIKVIVLHIDSPGGAVAPTQEIYNEILRVRYEDGKKVIASMSSVAASGGYYIACAADKIMANPGTLVGSIGVIIQFYTAGKLMEKIGIEVEKVKSGELKDIGSLDRRMTEKERQMLTAAVMDTYEQFIEAVASGRSLDKGSVYALADGSIFSGRQAQRNGLVDTLGGFEDAVRYAVDLVGLKGEPRIVKESKPKQGWLDLLGSTLGNLKEMTELSPDGPKVLYFY